MFGFLRTLLKKLKAATPKLYFFATQIGKKYFGNYFGIFPRPLANEISAIKNVIYSSQWNMAYGKSLEHEKLEAEFAAYVGSAHAIAVNTGGMALQMSMRALGLKPGNEVILQVDTCSASASAILNAGCTPIFSDISEQSFMLSKNGVLENIGPNTKAILGTHMWGNTEDMDLVSALCKDKNLYVIEDACLALGARFKKKMVGSNGHVGVFSFGCLKPIQSGEGGMIVTDDSALAKELRSLRHWGDRTIDYGIRDVTQLAWNGRMSEILAALLREQLKGYPTYLKRLRARVLEFQNYLRKFEGLELVLGASSNLEDNSFTQVVLKISEEKLKIKKEALRSELAIKGISTWHANFEAINSLSFFKNATWKDWVIKGDLEKASQNYQQEFGVSKKVFTSTGLGINKNCFHTDSRLKHLQHQLDVILGGHA